MKLRNLLAYFVSVYSDSAIDSCYDYIDVAVRPLLPSNFRSISHFVPSHHAHRVEFFVPFPTVKSASQSVKNSLRY